MQGKWSAGKIAAVICGGIAAAIVLLVTFYIGVFQLVKGVLALSISHEDHHQAYDHGYDYDYDHDYDYDYDYGYDYDYDPEGYDGYNDESGKEKKEWSDGDASSEYYEFHNAIREDLSYWVEFETDDEVMGENENIFLNVSYPVFYSEDETDLAGVNSAAQKELEELQDYMHYVSEWLSDDEEFSFEVESYVTYMDEEILSIAYMEYGYLNGERYESYVISVNIDMNSKMALTNSQLLNIDDDFSIEFRNRCEKQNGEIDSLYYYSDQDITELLNSEDSLILFYTPLGMEVGFNYYYGWVTVTYPDYQKYQRNF